jgi:hypothetical protein
MSAVSMLAGRAARLGGMALLLLTFGGATVAATTAEAAHYCSGTFASHDSCEYSSRQYTSYNEVDASNDAVCEALSNASPPPHPTVGILATPQDCIGTGMSSTGAHYSASLPAYYPWIGNRHTFNVTVSTATHFDIWI